VTSSSNAWAVGFYWDGSKYLTLTERWNGVGWAVEPSVSPSQYESYIYGVTARSLKDAWIVGWDESNAFAAVTLTEHWDGVRWKYVSSPNVAGSESLLFDARFVTPTDVLAVGTSIDNDNYGETLALHFHC
jgi:hypothetical protein